VFWSPNYIDLYIKFPAGVRISAGWRQGLPKGPLGPSLEEVPEGELFTRSAAVPRLGIGHEHLDGEKVHSLEFGYKGHWGGRFAVSVDAYYERHADFLTVGVPGGNPDFSRWTAPAAVPEASRKELEVAAAPEAAGLSQLEDGTSAIILAPRNAGTVDAYGCELSANLYLRPGVRVGGSYTYFKTREGDILPAVPRAANAPKHRGARVLAGITATF
jgi:outer membrane receptor protein involved in Fe transport